MLREEIISKGLYTHPQVPGFVSVKQYILLRRQGKKNLFLRFENHRREVVTALSFSVKQFDAKGSLINQEHFALTKVNCAGEGVLVFDKAIKIKERCADFRVTVHSATYGEYVYEAHGDTLRVLYQKEGSKPRVDTDALKRRMGGETHRVGPRTLNAPKPLFLFACIALVLMAILVGVQLYQFTRTEVLFTLDDVEYAFETNNHKDGPICITGYKGKAGNIVIPAEIEGHRITRIGKGALQRSSLRSVVIEGSVIVEANSFADNRFLQTVTLNKTTKVGDYAFSGCYSLTSVNLGTQLSDLGEGAFNGCLVMTEIKLPSTLKSIGSYAFAHCSALETLEIPEDVELIGADILKGCESLHTLTVPYIGAEPQDQEQLTYFFVDSPKALENITVTRVNEVYARMFRNMDRLRSIVFTQEIQSIGKQAFQNCRRLETFDIPKSITAIGEGAFENCMALNKIQLPSGLTEIRTDTFSGCGALESLELPPKLKRIYSGAFHNCKSLESVVLPNSLVSIDAGVFKGCNSLKSMTLPFLGGNADSVDTMSYYFDGPSQSLETVAIGSEVMLPDSCFADFTSLKSVTLPEEMKEIGRYAFAGCSSLEDVYLPDSVERIGTEAFSRCVSLKVIRLPSKITSLETRLFSQCTSLKSVNIPDGVTVIGEEAFAGSTSLEQVDLPSTLTSIGRAAFKDCNALKSLVLPNQITAINEKTFSGCYALTDITFPGLLVTINARAFENCRSLKNLTLPNSLTMLKEYAFLGCSALNSLTIPTFVETIETGVLGNCTALQELTLPYIGSSLADNTSKLGYLFATSPSAASSNSVVPSSLKKLTVTADTEVTEGVFSNVRGLEEVVLPDGVLTIPKNAFSNCASLKNVTLPQSVIKVSEFAFEGCTRLTKVELHEGLTTIERRAFYGCTALNSIVIPKSVTSLGSDMFGGCAALADLTMPELYGQSLNELFNLSVPQALKKVTLTNVKSLPAESFRDVTYLEEVVLEGELTSIDSNTFDGCTALRTVILPDSLTEIQDQVFQNCSSLSAIKLSSNLKTIGSRAFNGCTSLKAITLPTSLERIGDEAFNGCSALTSLTVPDSVTALGDYVFSGCNSLSELTIPFVGTGRISSGTLRQMFNFDVPTSLTKVTLTDMENLSYGAFEYCWDLEEIVLPDNLKTISPYAFNNCTSIERMVIPASVTEIGWWAFESCQRLYLVENLSNVDLKDNYSYTGVTTYALKICQNGEQPLTVTQNGLVFLLGDDSEWYLIDYPSDSTELSLPESFVVSGEGEDTVISSYRIPAYLFEGNQTLEAVHIPSAVVSLGSYAFANCTSLSTVTFASTSALTEIPYYCFASAALVKVVLPEGIREIAACAFRYCTQLKSVSIPSTVIQIQDDAFYGCQVLEEVYNLSALAIQKGSDEHGYVGYYALLIHSSSSAESLHEVVVNGLTFKKSDDFWLLVGYTMLPEKLTLSTFEYQGKTVSSYRIMANAFANSRVLKELVIDDAVVEIGDRAFYNCYNLTSVSFAANTNLGYLGSSIFAGCSSLRSAVLPQNLKQIPENAFNNTDLTSIVIPDSVTFIGDYAFASCYSLETVTLNESSELEQIEYSAFRHCDNLRSILLPRKLNQIGNQAFYNCTRLMEVYNLSPLSVIAEDTSNGSVAYYAFAVYDSIPAKRETQTLTVNGSVAKFLLYEGAWYLYEMDSNSIDNSILYLPVLGEGDSIRSYIVTSQVLLINSYYDSVMIPTDVSRILQNGVSRLKYVYYEGTANSWNALADFSKESPYVSYYAECVHAKDGTWKFNESGRVDSTASPVKETIVKDANCTEPGQADVKCLGCNQTWKAEIVPNDVHDLNENNTCNRCGIVRIAVTAENLESLSILTNDSIYPFAFNAEGELVSSNIDYGTSANLVINADKEYTFSCVLRKDLSSDIMRVRVNGITEHSVSTDPAGDSFTYTLHPGDTLMISFLCRNLETATRETHAYIKDLVLLDRSNVK